jgi:hypothetical protein
MKASPAPPFNTARRHEMAGSSHEDEANAPSVPPAPLDPSAVRSIIAGIMLAMFLSALEQTIIAPALPTIGVRLGDIENLSVSLERDGGDAAIRQAVRHLRPAQHLADRRDDLHGRVGGLRSRRRCGRSPRRVRCRASAAAAFCRSPWRSSPTLSPRVSDRATRPSPP